MDFESFFTLILFILFFVLPSVLKQIKLRKNKTAKKVKPKPKKRMPLLGKLGERIQQALRELEQQALQQRESASEKDSFWESLAGEDDPGREAYLSGEDLLEPGEKTGPPPLVEPAARPVDVPVPELKRSGQAAPDMSRREIQPVEAGPAFQFRKHPLQNAIILSEILSKPVSLRTD